jgi:hypothetical protein
MTKKPDSEFTDMGTFLYEIGNRLNKEGDSLLALAKVWFSEGNEYRVLRQYGVDLINLSEQLLEIKGQLCRPCLMKSVAIILSFTNSPSEERETDQNQHEDILTGNQ